MSEESAHYSFRCHPVDDADISSVLDAASRLERSRLIKRLIRAGISAEAYIKVMPRPSAPQQINDMSYEDDPDVSQVRNNHFHPVPKPGSKK